MVIFFDSINNAVYKNVCRINLTPHEFIFYRYLSQRESTVIDSRELIHHIWPRRQDTINQNNLSQLAFRVRDKLKTAGIPATIKASLKYGCMMSYEKKFLTINIDNKLNSKLLNMLSNIN